MYIFYKLKHRISENRLFYLEYPIELEVVAGQDV